MLRQHDGDDEASGLPKDHDLQAVEEVGPEGDTNENGEDMIHKSWFGIIGLLALCAGLLFWPTQAQTQHGIMLTWTAGTPGAGQVAATGYLVDRATVTGGPYTQIASVTTTSYLDTTGTAGSKYYYVIVGTAPGAINAAPSTEVSASFLSQTAPATGLQAVAQ